MEAPGGGEVEIRRAAERDVESAARCHVAGWRDAYRGMISVAAYERMTTNLDQRIASWRHIVADTASDTWVGVEPTGRVVGFSSAGPRRDDGVGLPERELYSLYLARPRWGSGLAQRLLEVAIGDGPACLMVLKENPRARAFYAKAGFRPDGFEVYLEAYGAWEIRMVRP